MRPNQKRKQSRSFWTSSFQRIPLVAGIILGVLFLAHVFLNDQELPLYLQMLEKEDELKTQTLNLEHANESLRESIHGIQHDPSQLEQLARDQLGMVKDGEIVYQFVEPKDEESPKDP